MLPLMIYEETVVNEGDLMADFNETCIFTLVLHI